MTEEKPQRQKRQLTPEEMKRRKAMMAAKKAGARPKSPGAPEQKAGAKNTSLGSVVVRNDFYRDQYRMLVKIAFLEALTIIGLVCALVTTIVVNQQENVYFATTEDGRQIPMIPLNRPNLSKPALLSWATQAATEVMTFGFNDYRKRLQEASRHFTRQGWISFTQALQRADLITAVSENRQVVSSAPRSAPVLLSEGPINGVFQWEIQIPMLITTATGSASKSDTWMIKLIVERVPTLESPNGVGIKQWLAFQG